MDAATGEILWSHFVTPGDDAPVVSEERLYWASDSIYCFNLTSHQPEWVVGGGDGFNSNPVLHNGKLYCSVNKYGVPNAIKCFNAQNGTLIWTRNISCSIVSSCLSIWNNNLIVPTFEDPLCALNLESGSIMWENYDAIQGYWDTSPCVVDHVIYIGGYDGEVHAINAFTGDLIWSNKMSPVSAVEATPAYCDGIVVCGNRETMFALQADNGSALWQNDKGLHGSPTIADGIVYWGAFGKSINHADSI